MMKKVIFTIVIAVLLVGCSNDKNDNIEDTLVVEEDIMEENNNNNNEDINVDKYVEATMWLLNPNAGPKYWEATYDEYSDFIDRALLEDKIQEYWDNDGVDVTEYNMYEPEYNMIYNYKYPKYVEDIDYGLAPENTSTYNNNDNTLSYDEYCEQLKNIENIYVTRFYKCQDRNYVYTNLADFSNDYEYEIEAMKESFFKPYWDLEADVENEDTIIIKDKTLYDRGTYIGNTIYTLKLDSEKRIISIEEFMSTDRPDKTYGYGNEKPESSDNRDSESNNINNNSEENIGKKSENSDVEASFDDVYFNVKGYYPDDEKITNRIVVSDTLYNKYNIKEHEENLINAVCKFVPHPVLNAEFEESDKLYFTVYNAFDKEVNNSNEKYYTNYIVNIDLNGNYDIQEVGDFDAEYISKNKKMPDDSSVGNRILVEDDDVASKYRINDRYNEIIDYVTKNYEEHLVLRFLMEKNDTAVFAVSNWVTDSLGEEVDHEDLVGITRDDVKIIYQYSEEYSKLFYE